jgi:hypothetical protein
MAVDPPPQKRRASGFRRVRTAHDLQPRLDASIVGRRMGADGQYLSVRLDPSDRRIPLILIFSRSAN